MGQRENYEMAKEIYVLLKKQEKLTTLDRLGILEMVKLMVHETHMSMVGEYDPDYE